jgi:hypothetical protein
LSTSQMVPGAHQAAMICALMCLLLLDRLKRRLQPRKQKVVDRWKLH